MERHHHQPQEEGESCDPSSPQDYADEEVIPFSPDGTSPVIEAWVEKVKGTQGRFKGLRCVRKTIVSDSNDDEVKQKLAHEAKVLQSARHLHVIQLVHTYFNFDGKRLRFSIIMERADHSLQDVLKWEKDSESGFRHVKWFGCLAAALRHIHGIGIRHRDIKPSNILVSGDRVLLTDFGISKMGLGKTMPTTNIGAARSRTPDYCAPEVIAGRTRGRSADIFAAGATFLEMGLVGSDAVAESLDAVLRRGDGKSYGHNAEGVVNWLEANLARLERFEWQGEVLRLCIRMLDPDRDRRPLARDLLPAASWSCECVNVLPPAPNKTDELLTACKSGSAGTVRCLLRGGANPHVIGAMHLAAERGSCEIVQALLNRQVWVDSRNAAKQTPLHCAARNGLETVVQLLLHNGASVDAVDENEQTPLHCAAALGHIESVKTLLHAGANVEAWDLEGDTARELAGRRRWTEIEDLLGEWQAKSTRER